MLRGLKCNRCGFEFGKMYFDGDIAVCFMCHIKEEKIMSEEMVGQAEVFQQGYKKGKKDGIKEGMHMGINYMVLQNKSLSEIFEKTAIQTLEKSDQIFSMFTK